MISTLWCSQLLERTQQRQPQKRFEPSTEGYMFEDRFFHNHQQGFVSIYSSLAADAPLSFETSYQRLSDSSNSITLSARERRMPISSQKHGFQIATSRASSSVVTAILSDPGRALDFVQSCCLTTSSRIIPYHNNIRQPLCQAGERVCGLDFDFDFEKHRLLCSMAFM